MTRWILVFGLLLSTFTGCRETLAPPCTPEVAQSEIDAVPLKQLLVDLSIIDNYLQTKGITPLIDPTGIRYTVQTEGTGKSIECLENFLVARYKGFLVNPGPNELAENPLGLLDEGTLQSRLNGLILGWQVMLPRFKAGTKVTLYLPSGYCYGPNSRPAQIGSGKSSLPANSSLIFEIELLDVQ